jgi:hypothetical protein
LSGNKLNSVRFPAKILGQTTNLKIMYLSKNAGDKGGNCEICGYNKNQAALAFHHVNASTKSFPIDLRLCSSSSWEKLLLEAQKCQLLCLNCHAETHNPDFFT